MMRVIALLVLVGVAQGAPVAKAAPLAAKKVAEHVVLTVDQKKTMHSGCVSACSPSPVESKCVTACEAAMYKCIDETGPNETPKDTKKCQDGVLKLYQDTKGVEKKEEKKEEKKGAKKDGKKEEKKKAKMFLQLSRDDDDSAGLEDAEEGGDEMDSETEDQAEDEGDEASASEEEEDSSSDEVEEGTEEDSSEEDASWVTEDESDTADEAVEEESDEDESFVQTSRHVDDDDAESTDGDVDSAGLTQAQEEEGSTDEDESFVQASQQADDDVDSAGLSRGEEEEASTAEDDDAAQDGDAEQAESDDSSDAESDESADAESDESADTESDESEDTESDESEDTESEESGHDESLISWKPEHGSGMHLYEHPQGSTVVMPCPVESFGNAEACNAYFGNKADGEQCPQITCPRTPGVTMKLTCSGGCCPTCWAPDHVIAVDRHTSVDDAAVVDSAPQAPGSCGGVKCFALACAPGFSEGHVNGACCYSCVPGR